MLAESQYPPDNSSTLPGLYVQKMLHVYRQRGLDISSTLALAGIDVAMLAADTPLPARRALRWADGVLTAYPQPALGLAAGQATSVPEYGMLGYTILSAGTFGEVLGLWLRYGAALLARNHGGGFHRAGAFGELYAIEPDPRPYGESLRVFLHERTVASWHSVVGTLLGTELRFTDVRLVHAEPTWSAAYRELFRCPVYFRQPQTMLRFPLEWLDRPTRFANQQVRALCEAQCEALLAQMRAAGGITAELRRRLLQRPAHMASLEQVAADIGLSARTLRRKLVEEGTSFSDVQLELRMQLARDYLCNSRAAIADIAWLLGYADESAFGRAFKRASARTPLAYRRARAQALKIATGSAGQDSGSAGRSGRNS